MTPPRPLSRPGRLLATLVAAGALALLPATTGDAAATWTVQRVVLPSGGASIPQGYLPTLACPTTTDCVAAGTYATTSGVIRGLITSETQGHWSSRAIPLPSNAAGAPGVTPYQVACATAGNCAIVGSYQDTQGDTLPFAARESGGVWSAAALSLPADALGAGQNGQARAVACPTAATCVVVGTYLSAAANAPAEAFVETSTASGWSAAQTVTLPAGAAGMPGAMVNQIACTGAGTCLASGVYLDQDNVQHVFTVTETGGRWATATTLTPPANASLYAHVTVGGVACVASACTVIGTYLDHAGHVEPFAATEAGGTWSPAVELALPAGAAANPRTLDYGYVGLACPAVGSCVTGGQYVDARGRYQGFLVSQAGGTWGRAVTMPLPAGATSAGHNGGVVAFTCIRAGECRAGAAYLDAQGHYQAMVVSLTQGAWRTGTPLTLPGGAGTVGVDGGVYALVCRSNGVCTAAGSYQSSATAYQGFIATGS